MIVTYNCRDLVQACLAALDPQRSELTFEVLLVDNLSPDGTLSYVQRLFPWVDASTAGANVGFAVANNLALQRAAGDHILLLNPDTVVPPGGLALVVSALETRQEVGMLGCKLLRSDGTLDHACKRGFPTPESALAYFLQLRRFPWLGSRIADLSNSYTGGTLADDEAGFVDAINGAFMLVRRAAVESVGLLDERFWMYGEDLDWCYRFWQAGWSVFYWPEVTVLHHKAASSGTSRSWKVNRAFHRAMWLFYRKHLAHSRPSPIACFVWLGIWSKLLLSATLSLLRRVRTSGSRGAPEAPAGAL